MEYVVFASSLVFIAMLSLMNPANEWFKSMGKHGKATLILILCFVVPFLGSRFGAVDALSAAPSGIRLVRLFFILVLFFVTSKMLLIRPAIFTMCGAPAKYMLAFCFFALLSASYSVDGLVTGYKAFEILTLVMAGICFAGELDGLDDIEWLTNSLSMVMLFFVVSALMGALLAPNLAFVQTTTSSQSSAVLIRGVSPVINPNSLTQFGALLFVFSFIQLIRRDSARKSRGIWLILVMACTVMLLAHSRTSIFASLIAIGGVLFFGRYRVLAVFLLLAGLGGVLYSQGFVTAFILRGQTEEQFSGLSGRSLFWENIWPLVQEAMWIGHGYYAAGRELLGSSSVDNTYLEVLLGVGFLGLSIFVVPLILTAYGILRMRPKKHDSEQFTILWFQLMTLFVIILVRSLTGPSFAQMHTNLPMYMILLVGVYALRKYRYAEPGSKGDSDQCKSPPLTADDRILRRKTRFR